MYTLQGTRSRDFREKKSGRKKTPKARPKFFALYLGLRPWGKGAGSLIRPILRALRRCDCPMNRPDKEKSKKHTGGRPRNGGKNGLPGGYIASAAVESVAGPGPDSVLAARDVSGVM